MAEQEEVRFEWVDGPDSGGPHPATQEEWEAIDARLVENGWMPLNRILTRVLLAKRGEEIVGFHVMQLLPHAEPLYVAPAERGTTLPAQLADRMVEFLKASNARGWMVLAGNAHTERLCRERGMKKIADAVYMTQ